MLIYHRPEHVLSTLPLELWAEIVKLSLGSQILWAILGPDATPDVLGVLYVCKRFYDVGKVLVQDWFQDTDGVPRSP